MILSVLPCALAAPGRRISPTPAASTPAPASLRNSRRETPDSRFLAMRASPRQRGTARRLGGEAGAAWAAPRGRSAAGALPPLELPLERVARAEEDQVGGGVVGEEGGPAAR